MLDASVVVEWFAPRNEITAKSSASILRRAAEEPRAFATPSLLYHEVHAVLCRKLDTAEAVAGALDALWRLSLPVVGWDQTLARRSSQLSFDQRISGYDATYLAVAEALRGIWLTLDERAHTRVASLGLSRVLS